MLFSHILERNPFNIGMPSAYCLCSTGLNDKVKQIESTNQLACESHSRSIMQASYAQCDWLHWGIFPDSKKQCSLLQGLEDSGLARSSPFLAIFSPHHIPCFIICTSASCVIIFVPLPIFFLCNIDSLRGT